MKNFKTALLASVVLFAPLLGFAQAVSGFHPVVTQGTLTRFQVVQPNGTSNIPNNTNGTFDVFAADGTTKIGKITVTNGVPGPFQPN